MAFTWKEKYATIIDSSTWSQSIEGYKITNVFGLAWNYYIAYTKFITGLDLTMDMGWKIETFYANCYKLGYASEFKSNKVISYNLENNGFAYHDLKEIILKNENKIVATKKEAADLKQQVIDTSQKVVALEDKSGGTSVEEWTVIKDISAPVFTLLCSTGATLAAGTGLAAFSADGLSLDGLIVELA